MQNSIQHNIRILIDTMLPKGSIVPWHDADGHHYELAYLPDRPMVDSVTSKGNILDKKYLKVWAVKRAIQHIRDNWQRLLSDPVAVLAEAENVHKEILEDAGNIGHRTHEIIEQWLSDISVSIVSLALPTEDTRVISGIRAAEKFVRENHIVPIYPELLVGSKKYQTAGTLDLLCFRGKELNKNNTPSCVHEFWETSNGKKHECIRCGLKIRYELALIDWKSSNSIDKPEYMMQVSTYYECLKECTGLKPRYIGIVQLNKKDGSYDILEVSLKKQKSAFEAFAHLTKTYDWLNSEAAEFDGKIKKILQI